MVARGIANIGQKAWMVRFNSPYVFHFRTSSRLSTLTLHNPRLAVSRSRLTLRGTELRTRRTSASFLLLLPSFRASAAEADHLPITQQLLPSERHYYDELDARSSRSRVRSPSPSISSQADLFILTPSQMARLHLLLPHSQRPVHRSSSLVPRVASRFHRLPLPPALRRFSRTRRLCEHFSPDREWDGGCAGE
jgi:hypothetical protein